jgi:hypothetical protein
VLLLLPPGGEVMIIGSKGISAGASCPGTALLLVLLLVLPLVLPLPLLL